MENPPFVQVDELERRLKVTAFLNKVSSANRRIVLNLEIPPFV